MPVETGPHNIDSARMILKPDGHAVVKQVTENFYPELESDFGDFHGHVLIQRHEFNSAWPTWEVHPHGDEFVYLLEGDTDFVLFEQGAERTVRVNDPGSFVMVPRGAWHTARPHTRTVMLFVTPGEGTENRELPPGYSG
jgi:mannose-6-phosphate isomerase-like protein (cupin superfamily)